MITRLKLSTIEQGLPKYRSMLAGNDAYIPTSFESIATANGTGSSGTITFSSIPSTYQHLQIRFIAKSTRTNADIPDSIGIRFNSDTGSNYAYHYLQGDGSTVSASGAATQTQAAQQGWTVPNFTGRTSTVGVGIIDIHDYASTTKTKTIRSFYGSEANIAGQGYAVDLASGLWNSTSAINSISLICSQNFTTSSTFALYGIKGA